MIRLLTIASLAALGACAGGPLGGDARFGAATEANIANQSVNPRAANPDTTIPGGEGGRAGQPVERLREGQAEELAGEGLD